MVCSNQQMIVQSWPFLMREHQVTGGGQTASASQCPPAHYADNGLRMVPHHGEQRTERPGVFQVLLFTHRRDAFEFVRRNWAQINEVFPRNTISRTIETVKTLDRPADVAQAQAFFSEHPVEQAAKTLEQILERQQVNADVRSRNEDTLREALR